MQFQSILAIFLNSVERVAALGLIGVSAAGLLDVGKKSPTAFSSVPMAFFYALLPAASHVDAASSEQDRLRNLRTLYLSSSRYANLCMAVFVAVVACWARPLLHVWLGPQLPERQMLVPLFVVFAVAMQWHMLTGLGTSMFRGMGRVYEEFTYSIPNLLLLAVTLPVAHWIQGRWTEECAIYRGNQQVVWVQLKKFMDSGNALADLRLRRDDVIYVPNMSERFVSVMGEVKNPGAITLTSSSTLASVVAQAGGFTEVAGRNPHIQIVDPATGTSHFYRLRDVLNPVRTREIQLKPGEIVFVPRSGFAQATYVIQRLTPLFILSNLAYMAPML